MGFHDDPDKITFDKAEVLVERFIRQKAEMTNRVTSKDVAKCYDVEPSKHNLYRISRMLGERLEVTRESGAKPKQYRLPNDATPDGESSS